ncbi:MAG: hypothetical protein JSW59_00235 [Phycisphaerales bacterium]|nr:MAG: hypothetical protein JSW59_00235 [Phycisphaerales bacterium]
MGKALSFLITALLAGAALGASGFDTTLIPEPPLLREGFVLRGVDGRLSGPDSNDAWFFELGADVNDFRDVLEAGTKVQVLPSSTLEKMIADGRRRSEMAFRLWNGRVTRYKGRNFIFPSFFLPIRQEKESEPKTPERPQPAKPDEMIETPSDRELEHIPITRDPNDVLTIPSDLFDKLRATRKAMAARVRRIVDSNEVSAVEPNLPNNSRNQPQKQRYRGGADSVFVNRTGFIVGQDDESFVFVLDALGRGVLQQSFHLLPCEALELAELKVSAGFEPVRFKIAGILTKYDNTDYLLLQKATPAHSHGNFGR